MRIHCISYKNIVKNNQRVEERNLKEQIPKNVEPFLVEKWATLISSMKEWCRKRRKLPQSKKKLPKLLITSQWPCEGWRDELASPGAPASEQVCSHPPFPHRPSCTWTYSCGQGKAHRAFLREAACWGLGTWQEKSIWGTSGSPWMQAITTEVWWWGRKRKRDLPRVRKLRARINKEHSEQLKI